MEGCSLVRYIALVLLVLALELGLLIGLAVYFNINLLTMMFFGATFFVFFAFLISSSGDMLSKKQELAAFQASGGTHIPKYEKLTLRFGPFLAGSILCLLTYFAMAYFM
jgi:hypothetical protein